MQGMFFDIIYDIIYVIIKYHIRHTCVLFLQMSCTKYFHYPCVLASGGFQEITNHSSFCKEHIYQVPSVCEFSKSCFFPSLYMYILVILNKHICIYSIS